MNFSLHYTLIYDIFSSEPLLQQKTIFSVEIPKIYADTRPLAFCHRFHPINTHLNNNEIIIISTEQNRASRASTKKN